MPSDIDLAADIATLVRQQATLKLPSFSTEIAWHLGTTVRAIAIERGLSLVIDVRRFGSPHQQLFYSALPETSPDLARWITRKVNVVARFHQSSYHVGLLLKQAGLTFQERYGLPDDDYAAHGGGFPLAVEGAGIVGCLTLSGLPQRDDHNLVVEALCRITGHDHEALRLPS